LGLNVLAKSITGVFSSGKRFGLLIAKEGSLKIKITIDRIIPKK
jgi:hypothetical protein